MIYTYDDIVKTTKEEYRFMRLSRNDIGKCITVQEGCSGIVFGGVIRRFYKGHIIFEDTTITNDYCETATKCLTPEEISEHPSSRVCIYNPSSGDEKIYKAKELVWHIPSKVAFNTDILKPESRFFMIASNKCGIVEVEDVCETIISFEEIGTLRGGCRMVYSINSETLKDITLKPIKELTNYDLLLRGFSGYKLSPSLLIKLQALLGDTKAIPDEDFEKE